MFIRNVLILQCGRFRDISPTEKISSLTLYQFKTHDAFLFLRNLIVINVKMEENYLQILIFIPITTTIETL